MSVGPNTARSSTVALPPGSRLDSPGGGEATTQTQVDRAEVQ